MTQQRNLKRLREKFGLSRKRLAEISGVSTATIFRYEQGESGSQPLVAERLKKITRILEKREHKE